MIHRSEINSSRWVETTILRNDGLEEFREKPQYGNRHAVFEQGSDWGEIHYDKHNALDFPIGTTNHLAKYIEEKTGIAENRVKTGIIVGGIIGFGIAGILLKKRIGM